MSKLKLNITMSIDGFAAGPDQSPEHPLGLGGEKLHGWLYRSRRSVEATARKAARSTRVRPSPRKSSAAPARRSWAGTCSAAAQVRGTSRGKAGGETIHPSTIPSSSSLIISASHWRCRAERRSTSPPPGSSRRSSRRGRQPERRTFTRGRGIGRAAVPRSGSARRDRRLDRADPARWRRPAVRKPGSGEARAGRVGRGARSDSHQVRPGVAARWSRLRRVGGDLVSRRSRLRCVETALRLGMAVRWRPVIKNDHAYGRLGAVAV